jgi:hypothetical protein
MKRVRAAKIRKHVAEKRALTKGRGGYSRIFHHVESSWGIMIARNHLKSSIYETSRGSETWVGWDSNPEPIP